MRLRGTALHRGGPASVELEARAGPLSIRQRGREALLDSLVALRTDYGLTVGTAGADISLDLAEHLLSALGGLGIHEGLAIHTDDDELPLLDGGALVYCEALESLHLAWSREPRLVVGRELTLEIGQSTYRFEPHHGVEVTVEVSFPPPIGRERASWSGDPESYVRDIAPARTFGWLADAEELRRLGRARGATPGPVIVLTPSGALGPGPEPDECARHKLLDLIGDLRLYGGPPRGVVVASRPGHTATHSAVREAFRRGCLRRPGRAD